MRKRRADAIGYGNLTEADCAAVRAYLDGIGVKAIQDLLEVRGRSRLYRLVKIFGLPKRRAGRIKAKPPS